MERQKIKEEDKIHEQWYKEAKGMTLEGLPEFLDRLMDNYGHDYGTICHALSAGAVATCWAMNKHQQGGITGFQGSCVMWGFIQHWMQKDGPLRLIDYSDLLYPQKEDEFLTISKDTFEWLQKEAERNIKESNRELCSFAVLKHWLNIASGEIPFGLKIKD